VRSKFGSLIIVMAIVLFQSHSYGLELTDESKLRKLSYQMRGLPPTPKEFADLVKAKDTESNLNAFFRSKVEEYYKSPWTASKLTERLFEDWRIENPGTPLTEAFLEQKDTEIGLGYPPTSQNDTALVKVIQSALTQGDSWDEILISNSFLKITEVTSTIQKIRQVYEYSSMSRIKAFKDAVMSAGKKMDSTEEIQAVLDAYIKEKPLDSTTQNPIFTSIGPTPFVRNSHLDMKLTILILQGALEQGSPKYNDLVAHLRQVKDLNYYSSQITSSVFIPPNQTATSIATASTKELPQMIFSLNDVTSRYKKTIYSKAAAFFRIYLCDDMQQVALPDGGSKSQEAFKFIHKSTPSAVTDAPPPPTQTIMNVKPQHVQPQCLGCHVKLDPMETIFNKKFDRLSFTATGPKQSVFNFSYDDYNGRTITIPVNNVDELPALISKQPQYIRCQSEKFWNWFIGTDVPLSPKQRDELEKVYVTNESKPLEIIKYLTSLKLFSSDSFLSEPKQFNNVRPIFQKCHGCHKSDPTIPSLLEIPFNLNRTSQAEKMADHLDILKSVVKLTNILGDQKGIKMPTKDAGWKISDAERSTLIKWIADGAKDENGTDTITTEQKNKILAPAKAGVMEVVNQPSQLVPTMRPTWQRVLTYSEIIKTLPLKIDTTSTYSSTCANELLGKKYVLGHPDLYTARPVSETLDNAYRESYRKCVVRLLKQSQTSFAVNVQMNPAGINLSSKIRLYSTGLYSLAIQITKETPLESVFSVISKMKWSDLDEQQKLKIIQQQIDFTVGPNLNHIEAEMDLAKNVMKAVDRIATDPSKNDLISASYFSLYYILNSNSFLVY